MNAPGGAHGEALTSAGAAGLVDALADVTGRLAEGDYARLDAAALIETLAGFETACRCMEATGFEIIARLREQGAAQTLAGTSLVDLLADRLHLSVRAARARMRAAEDLAPAAGISGEHVPPRREATAAACREGAISTAHATVIRRFFDRLPAGIDADVRAYAEDQLVDLARAAGPDEVAKAADRLRGYLDPDGSDDSDRARRHKTFLHLDAQRPDGMSTGRFRVDAELRSYLEALFAVYAQPGRANPDDPAGEPGADTCPVPADHTADHTADDTADDTDGDAGGDTGGHGCEGAGGDAGDTSADPGGPADRPAGGDREDPDGSATDGPDNSAADGAGGPADGPDDSAAGAGRDGARPMDLRNAGQRRADALKAGLRALLASGKLGEHRGLPVRVVITADIADLEHAAGFGDTAGGTRVPMREVIRMASHAYHCLTVFGADGTPLHLGRTKRIATPAQRLVLYAGDKGCTFPGCTAPAYHSQVHHLDEWAAGGSSDIDTLTLACQRHHRLVGDGPHQWATTRAGPDTPRPGRTLWHPPAIIDPDRRGRINHYHHPGEYLTDDQYHRYPAYRQQHRMHRPGARHRG